MLQLCCDWCPVYRFNRYWTRMQLEIFTSWTTDLIEWWTWFHLHTLFFSSLVHLPFKISTFSRWSNFEASVTQPQTYLMHSKIKIDRYQRLIRHFIAPATTIQYSAESFRWLFSRHGYNSCQCHTWIRFSSIVARFFLPTTFLNNAKQGHRS